MAPSGDSHVTPSGASISSSPSGSSTPVHDFSNHYYVHPNENPSTKLVTAVLDGSNYHGWAEAMTMVLDMKNKLGFVDGTIPKPNEQDPNFRSWKRCNSLIRSWINHFVSPEIASSVLYLAQASAVWSALRNRFSHGDNVRILQLHSDLYSMKQGDLSITNYFTKLRTLWDELFNYRPIPNCDSSPTGSCKTVTTFQLYRECDLFYAFSMDWMNPTMLLFLRSWCLILSLTLTRFSPWFPRSWQDRIQA